MQNPDEPNLPFAQSSSLRRQEYYDYIVNGDHWTFGKMVNKKVRWTESNAQQYRNKGYSVVKVEGTENKAKSESEQILIESEKMKSLKTMEEDEVELK